MNIRLFTDPILMLKYPFYFHNKLLIDVLVVVSLLFNASHEFL